MRVALLSTLEPATDAATARGLLRVGGRTILEHQLGAALAFGCERVLCLAEGSGSGVRAVQRLAERRGLAFAFVGGGHDLARLIAPDDQVLVMSGGLLAPVADLIELAGAGPAIVVQPAASGLAGGFERIDLHHAGGGVLHLPGTLVAGLSELPDDWHPVSALLRIAAQAGVPQRELPPHLVPGGLWILVHGEADARASERSWLRRYTSVRLAAGPGFWLAAKAVQRLGPGLLQAGKPPRLVSLAAVVLAAAAAGLAWAGLANAALGLLALAWVVHQGAELLVRIVQDPLPFSSRAMAVSNGIGWLLDASFVFCVGRRLEQAGSHALPPLSAGLVALTLFALLRLVPQLFPAPAWARWFEDRFLAAVMLAGAAATDMFAPAVMAASLLTIVVAMALAPPARSVPPLGEDRGLA